MKQWLGRDVFELNGLTRTIDTTDLLSVLTTQYRMHPGIMSLVNGPSYGNRLQAGPGTYTVVRTCLASFTFTIIPVDQWFIPSSRTKKGAE